MENTLVIKKSDRVLEMVKSNGVYTIKKISFIKKWWGNYLNRLNKITHGKAQCCE